MAQKPAARAAGVILLPSGRHDENQNDVAQNLPTDLPNDFIETLNEAFLALDVNNKGFIRGKQIGYLMRMIGENPTEDELVQILSEAEIDENDKLRISEIISIMHRRMHGINLEKEIRLAFQVFDRSGDGVISATEFRQTMTNFGVQATDTEVDEILKSADIDGDGYLNYDEFAKLISS